MILEKNVFKLQLMSVQPLYYTTKFNSEMKTKYFVILLFFFFIAIEKHLQYLIFLKPIQML